jgi:hypothetical protein
LGVSFFKALIFTSQMNFRRQSLREERVKKKTKTMRTEKPRWWNQTYVIFLVLRRENRLMSRGELIPKVLELEKEIAKKRGLPTLFHGKTPQNTVSGRLTENNEKYFVKIIPEGTKRQFFKVSFQPGDFISAFGKYKEWTAKLIEQDWPYFFGDRNAQESPNKSSQSLERSIQLSLSSTNEGTEIPLESQNVALDQLNIHVRLSDCDDLDPSTKTVTLNGGTRNMLNNNILQTKKDYFIPKNIDEVLEVRESLIPNAGKGVFAKIDIPKHTYLGFYFGVPVDEDEFDSLKDGVGVASQYAHRYNHTVLDATNEDGILYDQVIEDLKCPFYYINESKKVNIAFVDGAVVNQIICMNTKFIHKGDELYVHYGPEISRPWLDLKEKNTVVEEGTNAISEISNDGKIENVNIA